MSLKIEQQPAKINRSGIVVDTILTGGKGETAKLSIFAKPCSPYCFELIFWDWSDKGGDYYVLKLNDSLPIDEYQINPESIDHLSKLITYVVEHGQKFVS